MMLLLKRNGRKNLEKRQETLSMEHPSFDTNEVLPDKSEHSLTGIISHTSEEISQAREELKRFTVERDIIAAGLKHIYEAEAKGTIDVATRDEMIRKYKTDLRRMDEELAARKRITQLQDSQDRT